MTYTICSFTDYQGDRIENGDMDGRGWRYFI
jgi:hypothetical protein